ncbi:MAG: hypothetical protein WD740_00020 [Anaerolineales bacterium]
MSYLTKQRWLKPPLLWKTQIEEKYYLFFFFAVFFAAFFAGFFFAAFFFAAMFLLPRIIAIGNGEANKV